MGKLSTRGEAGREAGPSAGVVSEPRAVGIQRHSIEFSVGGKHVEFFLILFRTSLDNHVFQELGLFAPYRQVPILGDFPQILAASKGYFPLNLVTFLGQDLQCPGKHVCSLLRPGKEGSGSMAADSVVRTDAACAPNPKPHHPRPFKFGTYLNYDYYHDYDYSKYQ